MNNEIQCAINEIHDMRAQYVAEVGEGRRVWPRSIKERVYWLGMNGLKPKQIAKLTAIPYETVCQWKYQKSLSGPKGFHNLTVTVPAKSLSTRNATVTVKSPENPINATVTVTTPKGFLIEGLPPDVALEFLLKIGVR